MESCELCRGSAFSNRNFASASSRISGERREKKVGIFWSAGIGLRYCAIAKERAEGLVWFWIGRHDRYEAILKS
ncbi:MAG: hypothetical protein DMF17_11155 [Verrucomicrobia bacterium]|nr:MAG: hypothetical protein DMF17_11155 [Verrucomicrobiota bacterium]